MPILNLLNQVAAGKSVDQNSSQLVNMYLTQDPNDQDKYQQAAYPTPGNTLFSSGSTTMRALFSEHGITYGVDGSTFFSVASNGTRTTLGTLNTSSGWCKICGIANELFIADNTNGYYYIISTTTFGTILTASSLGIVQSVDITMSGTLYDSNTTVSFSGGGGTGATGTVIITSGAITDVVITSGGHGYTSAPTVTFADPGGSGSGAAGTAVIATNAFPTAIQDINTQDEFGLVLVQNSQTWYASAISDLTTWSQLSFASTTGNQNYNQGIISYHRELWIFGTQVTEIWDNQGLVNFTFGRNNSVYLEYGLAATASLVKGTQALFFLAQNSSGGTIVMEANGYTLEKISTPAIDYQISTYTTTSDCIGIMYQQEGHEFYVLSFPTANTTLVYDATTQLWHTRQSLVSSQGRWLANCYTSNYGLRLIGDYSNGDLYNLDMTNNTENSSAITRTLITHPFYNQGTWIYCSLLQIDFDNAPGINLADWTLYVSRDGGRTYGTGKAAYPTQDANGMWRVRWLRLGQAKAFVFKLTTSSNIQAIILGAWANVTMGASI